MQVQSAPIESLSLLGKGSPSGAAAVLPVLLPSTASIARIQRHSLMWGYTVNLRDLLDANKSGCSAQQWDPERKRCEALVMLLTQLVILLPPTYHEVYSGAGKNGLGA
jgi:hypothetical protein